MKAHGEKCNVKEDGKVCGKKVLAQGMCSSHYQRVYRHGSTEKRSAGAKPKTEERLKVEEEVKNYRGKDAFYDISNKLEAEGYDKTRVRGALWHVLRNGKRRVKSK